MLAKIKSLIERLRYKVGEIWKVHKKIDKGEKRFECEGAIPQSLTFK